MVLQLTMVPQSPGRYLAQVAAPQASLQLLKDATERGKLVPALIVAPMEEFIMGK